MYVATAETYASRMSALETAPGAPRGTKPIFSPEDPAKYPPSATRRRCCAGYARLLASGAVC